MILFAFFSLKLAACQQEYCCYLSSVKSFKNKELFFLKGVRVSIKRGYRDHQNLNRVK